jgi:hypothetical protein
VELEVAFLPADPKPPPAATDKKGGKKSGTVSQLKTETEKPLQVRQLAGMTGVTAVLMLMGC